MLKEMTLRLGMRESQQTACCLNAEIRDEGEMS